MKSLGKFGEFGGMFVPELLMPALEELETAYLAFAKDRKFKEELRELLSTYAGRPTPLYHAKNLSGKYGAQIYLKREDLLHGGAHKTNNTLGQGLLAKYMGKKKIVAETGAGQHGAAVAMVGALFGMEVKVFMGAKDMERQAPNVLRMRLCGAEVIPVESGSKTLKDAVNEALRYWVNHVADTYYLLGSVAGPHPYPTIVRDFQKIIGEESRREMRKKIGRLPSAVIACVGGGSNAIGIFHAFLRDKNVQLIGVEPADGASINRGSKGSLHGAFTYILQDKYGQIREAHSISAGLDYPGVGPQHSNLHEIGRAEYVTVTDEEALAACKELCEEEGIIPALESSHALAYAKKHAKKLKKSDIVLVNLSGRGDKDLSVIADSRSAKQSP